MTNRRPTNGEIGCRRCVPDATRGTRLDPSSHVGSFGLFGLVEFRYILDAETEHERGPAVMADDYQLKYVGLVAAIIGGVVLLLGLVGLIVNLS